MANKDKDSQSHTSSSKTGGGTPRKQEPKLLFMRNSQRQGFTNAELSRLSGNNSANAIRELVQNSLDAAVERKADIAEVHFIVKETNCDDVPGIKEYKVALNNAKDFLKGHGEQTNSVANSLTKSANKNKFYTLFVRDNGIGFDKDRLAAMYDNGISKKGEGAIGAYGNGHFTAFPLSGLQYVLYGGINKGVSIFGGHAILASHIGSDTYRYGKDGYFVAALNHECREGEEPYIFLNEGYEDNFISDQMEFIKEHWTSGSVIAVPAFSCFEGKLDDVKDLIIQSVAMNFFVAIHNEKLRITVSINGEEKTLSKGNLESVLNKCKEQTTNSIKGFPSGIVAWNSYQTLIQGNLGEKGIIDTPKGKVELRIRIGEGNKDVALCRDGMWITRDVPRMRRTSFANKEPFDALLLIKDNGEEIYTLLKKAEGPDHIDIKRLGVRMLDDERREFNKCLDVIAAKIKSMVEDKEGDEFEPQDFIIFEGGQSIHSARTMNSGANKLGKAVPVSKMGERTKAGKKGKKTPKSALKSGNVLDVKISSKRRDKGVADICFEPIDECEDVEFRMQVDRGRDDTCTGQLDKEDWETISLKSVKIGGRVIPADRFLPPDSDKKVGVHIGAVAAKQPYNMTVEYDAPPSMLGDHAIRWIFIRRKKSSPVAEGEQS